MYKDMEISDKDDAVKNANFPNRVNTEANKNSAYIKNESSKMNENDYLLAQLDNKACV
jgi:hypothetical protein